MIQYKNYILLFGGFYDIGVDVRYYDDFWAFNCQKRCWKRIDTLVRPTARSGFQLFIHSETLFLYGTYTDSYTYDLYITDAKFDVVGGYCKVNKGKNAKGLVYTDLWSVKLNSDLKNCTWEKRKKAGVFPEYIF